MKKIEFRKNILLGLAGGLLAMSQGGLQAVEDQHTVDSQSLLAKSHCKNSKHGCADIALRDSPESGHIDDVDGLEDIEDSLNPEDETKQEKAPEDVKNR